MIRVTTVERCTDLRFVGSFHCYPPSLPSDHGKCWISSFARLERTIGSTVSNYGMIKTRQERYIREGGRVILTHRSTRSAYSNILIRRIRSSLTFSKDRRSPSRSAILACTGISRLGVRTKGVRTGGWTYPHLGAFDFPFVAVAFVSPPFGLEEMENGGESEVLATLGRREQIAGLLQLLLLLWLRLLLNLLLLTLGLLLPGDL